MTFNFNCKHVEGIYRGWITADLNARQHNWQAGRKDCRGIARQSQLPIEVEFAKAVEPFKVKPLKRSVFTRNTVDAGLTCILSCQKQMTSQTYTMHYCTVASRQSLDTACEGITFATTARLL